MASCWLARPGRDAVSTAVIFTPETSFDLCNFHHDVAADQFRLAAEAVGWLELFVGLVGGGRRELVPAFDDFDPASPARTVSTANLADADAQFSGNRQQRLPRGKFAALCCVSESHARHRRRIVLGSLWGDDGGLR